MLGLLTVQTMVEIGATHVVLASRSKEVARLRATRCRIFKRD